MTSGRVTILAAAAAVAFGAPLAAPHAAEAIKPINPICSAGGPLSTGACSLAGPDGGIGSSLTTQLALAPVEAWVVGGASFVLQETAHVLGETTSPQLTSTWFSATYWRVAGIAAVLTLPFLFAAALQALVRSDLGLLLRAAIGYLPLALLAVAIAAPVTMLLLAASDQLSATVSSAAGQEGADFLARATSLLATIGATVSSPFVVFLVGLLTVAGALVLWIELLVREAAVYVIVLMLPLAFAAFVWPARRIWAIRSIELLVALILSKFAIVAVLSLGGAALDQSANQSVTGLLAGAVLMALAAFAPWAMLRLIPLAEVASAAAGSLTAGSSAALQRLRQSDAWAAEGHHWATKTAQMRDLAGSGGARATKENVAANAQVAGVPPTGEPPPTAPTEPTPPAASGSSSAPPEPTPPPASGSSTAPPEPTISSTVVGTGTAADSSSPDEPSNEVFDVEHPGELSDPTPPSQGPSPENR